MVDVDMVHMARLDGHGLQPICCTTAYLDGYIAGHFLGYRQGLDHIRHEVDQAAAQVARQAAQNIGVRAARAKPYVKPRWAS